MRIAIACAAMLAAARSAALAAGNPDKDQTPVVKCDNLPASASIELLSNAETRTVCSEMVHILEGVTIADLREFSKVVAMLSVKGYETGEPTNIARKLVEIIRLRGLFNQEAKWNSTIEMVWKLWVAEKKLA